MFLYSASLEKHMEAYAQEVKMQELNELRQLAANKITRQSELFNISQFENMQKIQALLSQPVREVEREVVKQPEKKISQKKDLTVDTSAPKSTSPEKKPSSKGDPLINELKGSPKFKSLQKKNSGNDISDTQSEAPTVGTTDASSGSPINKPRGRRPQEYTKGGAKEDIKKLLPGKENKKERDDLIFLIDSWPSGEESVKSFYDQYLDKLILQKEAERNAQTAKGLKGRGIRKGIRRARR